MYSFPGDSDTDTGQPVGPFAVVGSNVIVQDENGEDRVTIREPLEMWHYNLQHWCAGKKVRGRRYPWGTVNIENKDHCDFLTLRSLVLAHHLQVQHSTHRSNV